MATQRFRFSLASAACWFAAVSIAFGLIRLGMSRGLPAIFDAFVIVGFFLLGACFGTPVGHFANGAIGARTGAKIGGGGFAVVGLVWIILRYI